MCPHYDQWMDGWWMNLVDFSLFCGFLLYLGVKKQCFEFMIILGFEMSIGIGFKVT